MKDPVEIISPTDNNINTNGKTHTISEDNLLSDSVNEKFSNGNGMRTSLTVSNVAESIRSSSSSLAKSECSQEKFCFKYYSIC